ncbi:MAG: hypothetical protein J6M93_05040, partial [Succinivibrio sp.]|nr:hypothetical protein [Succinivibrio sp.]
ADFVVGLKSNQSALEDDVKTAFEFLDKDKYNHQCWTFEKVLEGHGRIETKQIEIIEMKNAVRTELKI